MPGGMSLGPRRVGTTFLLWVLGFIGSAGRGLILSAVLARCPPACASSHCGPVVCRTRSFFLNHSLLSSFVASWFSS